MASTKRRLRLLLAALLLAAAAAACDVKWGGGHIALERPHTPGERTASTATAPPPKPLPRPPFVFLVRLRPDGAASAVPFARVSATGLEALGWPSDAGAGYRARFDSAFASAGSGLSLRIAGERAGRLIVTGTRMSVNASCPSVVDGRVLVLPGQKVPRWAFAVGPGSGESVPTRATVASPDDRTRTFGPILAENLLRAAGVDRPYLAQRADLQAVSLPGDTLPGMAATYLIGDTLAPVAPSSTSAVSLFYVASFEPARGYVPVWNVVHRYGSASDKRVLTWLGSLRVEGTMLYMVSLVDGSGRWIATHRPGGTAELAWTESGPCPALRSIEEAPRAESGTGTSGAGTGTSGSGTATGRKTGT